MPTPVVPSSQMTADKTLGGMTPRPTASSSDALRRGWDERIKAQSVFSARTTSQRYVDAVKKTLAEIASRQISPQDAERKLQLALRDLGYSPEAGFRGEGGVPPASPGSIRDLSSSRRIQLIIDTNVKQARSLGQIAASEDPMQLMMDPAWRLTRTGARKKPRGDWRRRWAEAGARCGWKGAIRKDMIALKTSPIWQALADGAGGFRDTLGSPYPPFAFGSGLAWVNVGRSEWKRLCAAEGVPDGLEDITAKAKELKAGKGSAALVGSVGPQSGSVGAAPIGGVLGRVVLTEAPGGVLGGSGAIPAVPPAAEPMRDIYKPDFRSRGNAEKAVDEALAEVRQVKGAAVDAESRTAELVDECERYAGDKPEGREAVLLAAVRKHRAVVDDAVMRLGSLEGRVVNYGGAIGATPPPRDKGEQGDFDARMNRYALAARATARDAAAQGARVDRAVEAAWRTAEMLGSGATCRDILARVDAEKAEVLGDERGDAEREYIDAKAALGERLGGEVKKRMDDARMAMRRAVSAVRRARAAVSSACADGGDVDAAVRAEAKFDKAVAECRRRYGELHAAVVAALAETGPDAGGENG